MVFIAGIGICAFGVRTDPEREPTKLGLDALMAAEAGRIVTAAQPVFQECYFEAEDFADAATQAIVSIELDRRGVLEEILELAAVSLPDRALLSLDPSIGVAQVRVSTAIMMDVDGNYSALEKLLSLDDCRSIEVANAFIKSQFSACYNERSLHCTIGILKEYNGQSSPAVENMAYQMIAIKVLDRVMEYHDIE